MTAIPHPLDPEPQLTAVAVHHSTWYFDASQSLAHSNFMETDAIRFQAGSSLSDLYTEDVHSAVQTSTAFLSGS